jgi:hypothetical protein
VPDKLDESDELIKVNKILYLESTSTYKFMNFVHYKIFRLNIMDVDKLETVENINCVIVKTENLPYVDKIITFCDITNLPIKIYISDANEIKKLIQKIDEHKHIKNIKYKIIDEFII